MSLDQDVDQLLRRSNRLLLLQLGSTATIFVVFLITRQWWQAGLIVIVGILTHIYFNETLKYRAARDDTSERVIAVHTEFMAIFAVSIKFHEMTRLVLNGEIDRITAREILSQDILEAKASLTGEVSQGVMFLLEIEAHLHSDDFWCY